MRMRLLDLSGRNPLLNYRHPKGNSLRIVDEVPSTIFERLSASGSSLLFEPLPEPSRREAGDLGLYARKRPVGEDAPELDLAAQAIAGDQALRAWAERCGINPSYELPAVPETTESRHRDSKLQTLFLPEGLESRLQGIDRKARSALAETGVNLLHLLFGFVEWPDGALNDPEPKRRIAPLVLMPVSLTRDERADRQTDTFRYHVARSAEDWSTNITFQEKCRQDFGIDIPSLAADEEHLEAYFATVEGVLPKGWRLLRCVTLGSVSFGKILMWRDLDPKNWSPELLADRTPFRRMLGDGSGGGIGDGPGLLDRVHEIDNDPEPPCTVIEADSSQHSVLVDVKIGRNLVVEGPPGTGKSQTIVNLIANALLGGQRVLFVAEKFAALDVVYRRLRQAHLGEFCLALHSQKPRAAFLQEMIEALGLRRTAPMPREYTGTLAHLGNARDVLTTYLQRLHEPTGPLGVPTYTILWRARLLLDRLGPEVQDILDDCIVPNPLGVDAQLLSRGRSLLERLGRAIDAANSEADPVHGHPWAGVTGVLATHAAMGEVINRAKLLSRACERAEEARAALITLAGTAPARSPSGLLAHLTTAEELPSLGDAPAEVIRATWEVRGVSRLRTLYDRLENIQQLWSSIPSRWRSPDAFGSDGAEGPRHVVLAGAALVGQETTYRGLVRATQGATTLAAHYERVQQLADALAGDFAVPPPTNARGQALLIEIAISGVALGPLCWDLRRSSLTATTAPIVLAQARATLDSLRAGAVDLDDLLDVAMRPTREELIGHLRALADAPSILPWVFSSTYRAATQCHRAMRRGLKSPRAAVLHDMHKLLRHTDGVGAFLTQPEYRSAWGEQPLTLASPVAETLAMSTWYHDSHAAANRLGPDGAAMVEALWAAPASHWQRASARLRNGGEVDLNALQKETQAIWGAMEVGTAPDLATSSSSDVASFLRQWPERVRALATLLAESGALLEDTPFSAILDTLLLWEDVTQREYETHNDILWLQGLGFPLLDARGPLGMLEAALTALGVLSDIALPPDWREWLAQDVHQRGQHLRDAASAAKPHIAQLATAATAFATATAFDATSWDPTAAVLTDASFDSLSGGIRRALNHEPALYRWCERQLASVAAMDAGLGDLVEQVIAGAIPTRHIADAYEALILSALANDALNDPIMHGAFGDMLSTTRRRFQELDRRAIDMTRALIRAQLAARPAIPGFQGHRVADLTEEALLRHEAGKQRRFIPIRALFARAGRAIQNLKPCYLMSPFAVAQYVGRNEPPFDLVIMDEASQMRPEDALGAIARARQVVIVGDTKQLPPTNFFNAAQDGDGTPMDEVAVPEESGMSATPPVADGTLLQRAESILHVAREKFPHRMLLWHYRSRHPKLIAFSNREFYENRLVLFPTPEADDPRAGVVFHRVEGIWTTRANPGEARAIAEAARTHAQEHPAQSLMIAAMNREQADLIDDILLRLEKEDDVWASYVQHWAHRPDADEQEPFVVKNLENVQGDERDRVIVSVTYGRDEAGNFYQRFGPLLTNGGERRLNVLFTRARIRMDLFCSFDPEDLRVEPSSSRGLQVFQRYLLYAKDVAWAQGQELGRAPDSDFEVAVADALRSRGLEVKAQVGVAGYFIDLAIVDPAHPTRFLLGVECDGATYHSAKSARDRDRLRQQVLERLGWQIHRIWSTDWFRDREGQVEAVLRRLALR